MKFIVTVCCLTLCACSSLMAKTFSGRVTHVSDGDTLWIQTATQSRPIKVRIQGIDAPESCQAWGSEATVALRQRLQGQTVQVDTRAKDDYQRILARLSYEGNDVGGWLVRHGHAWSYHHRRNPGPYALEQAAAQRQGLGLWGKNGSQAAAGLPQEPRAFRKQHGSCLR